nr:EOG090X0FQ9 [Eulimnadia texana]
MSTSSMHQDSTGGTNPFHPTETKPIQLVSQGFLSFPGVSLMAARGVRQWHRKPRGSPPAKSKLFRLPQKKILPEDEVKEMKRLHEKYKSEMKAIRQYFYEEAMKQADTGAAAQAMMKAEEEEHIRLMEENRLENEKTAKLREERLAREMEIDRERAERSLRLKEAEKQRALEEIEVFIREQKALATTFITRDSIETAILEALANPVDFNFAINKDGFVFRGKKVNIDDIPPEQRERLTPVSQ